ncbi:unnamed protein product [Phytophthora fragariaefolia]|uniref:Unnamed protein product n=1 Tax=Phytophthora fragariaefolia TaxID=1490495 RepID=A0A9W6Y2C7_9STRA|nr:unnamed protein product [Phytophthora fragariaefolia]
MANKSGSDVGGGDRHASSTAEGGTKKRAESDVGGGDRVPDLALDYKARINERRQTRDFNVEGSKHGVYSWSFDMEVFSRLPTREEYAKSKMAVDLELITALIYGVDGQATGLPADGQVVTISRID